MTTMQRPPAGPEATATRDDISRELGLLDEELIERIMALGPSVEDLRCARERVGHPPADPSRSGSHAERLVEAVRNEVGQDED